MALKTTVPVGRKLCSTHRAANQALSQHIQASNDAAAAAHSNQDIVHVSIESEESDIITDDSSEKYRAVVSVLLSVPKCRELTVKGPERDTRPEAVKDGEVMHKAYKLEGEAGAKRVADRLERKTWLKQELDGSDESSLEGLIAVTATATKAEKLIPPGEGWVRFNDEMLWDPRSQVYFAQTGPRMGQYLMQDEKPKMYKEVNTPHSGIEHPILVRAGGASSVRRGAKLERTVLLNELPKIARLALKFPLSFVDAPASAFALFEGIRSAEAADWCAKNLHTKLIPLLATKIHFWETKELQGALESVLAELDAELLKSSHSFSACSAVVALLLGDRLIISGVGQVRVVLLFDDGSTRTVLTCTNDPTSDSERERIEAAKGILNDGCLYRSLEGETDAQRILRARHDFEVLQLEVGSPSDEKQVRTAYKKLALRVHPDKASQEGDIEAFTKAFSRLESAKEAVETMLNADAESCRELNKVLRTEVHTREGAAELLGVDRAASTDTEAVAEEASQAAKKQIKRLAKMEGVARDYNLAVAICNEAVETIRRPNSVEALPRQEALLRLGLPTSRAMGARDLRFPAKLVVMQPQSTCWHVPTDKRCRLAMLCGATSLLADGQLVASTLQLKRRPKASALRWCLDADPAAASVGAICIGFEVKKGDKKPQEPAAKRLRAGPSGQQRAGSIFLRHILFRHQQIRGDPLARREGAARGPIEAEVAAMSALDRLLADKNAFVKICRELSDCQSADQPGNLAGHLGWVVKGEQEPSFDEAVFELGMNEFSDLVTTSRGVHLFQRLG